MGISCQKVTEFIEKQALFGLTLLEKFQLKFHLKICNHCESYKNQSKLIDDMLGDSEFISLKLSDKVKQEIIRNCGED